MEDGSRKDINFFAMDLCGRLGAIKPRKTFTAQFVNDHSPEKMVQSKHVDRLEKISKELKNLGLADLKLDLNNCPQSFFTIHKTGGKWDACQVVITPERSVFASVTQWVRYAGQPLNFFSGETRSVFYEERDSDIVPIICEEDVSVPQYFASRLRHFGQGLDESSDQETISFYSFGRRKSGSGLGQSFSAFYDFNLTAAACSEAGRLFSERRGRNGKLIPEGGSVRDFRNQTAGLRYLEFEEAIVSSASTFDAAFYEKLPGFGTF